MESILYIESSLPPAITLDEYRRRRSDARRPKGLRRWLREARRTNGPVS